MLLTFLLIQFFDGSNGKVKERERYNFGGSKKGSGEKKLREMETRALSSG